MFQAGEIIYFKREEDCRALRGEIVEQQGECYVVRGMRTATRSSRPLLTIPAGQVLPFQAVRKPKKNSRENGHGSGLSLPVDESVKRSQIGTERLGMNEGAVLFSDPMQQLCRRIVRRLGILQRHQGRQQPRAA